MNLEKLSTNDWRSPRLGLINVLEKPKSKSKITTVCHKCKSLIDIVYCELVRAVNRQSLYTEYYHCRRCLISLSNYKESQSNKSKNAISKIIAGASDRSKKLWQEAEYKKKVMNGLNSTCKSAEFKQNVSIAIKIKFKDQNYIDRIKIARRKYWSQTYRSDKILNTDDYIKSVNAVHANKYDYSKISYNNIKSKITIICPLHGEFVQRASHHLYYANGCPQCAHLRSSSNAECEIGNYITSYGFNIDYNNREILDNNAEIDIFIPSANIGIEYNGDYWHSYSSRESAFERYKHKWKFINALNHNIQLLQFFEFEWLNKQEIVKSIIRSKLHITDRIMARKCKIVELTNKEADIFISKTHLQGIHTARYNYGLLYNNELIACLTLSDHKQFEYEIIRYSSKLNTTIIGGLSRLFNYFIGIKKPNTVMTYADCRYSIGNAYLKLNFKLISHTKPGYFYIKNHKVYNRIKFQKHKLHKLLLIYDQSLTEAENVFNNGYRRIWNAGNYKLIWTK